jgi:hypothetical protein
LQRGQGLAAGVAQHEVERRETARPDRLDPLAGSETGQGHGRVEVVEDVQPRRVEHDLGRHHAIRAIRGNDRRFGIAQLAQCSRPDFLPVGIQRKAAALDLDQVAVFGVPGHVAFEKHDVVSLRRERPDQRPPQDGVTVTPRRTD